MSGKDIAMLETERLLLRNFELSDVESMYRNWANDPDVVRFMCYEVCESLEATQKHVTEWLEFFNNLPADSSWGLFAIILKSSSELIGTIDYHESDKEIRAAEIGYQLGKTWWGNGYATEALRILIKHCFETVGLNRLWADHNLLNIASGKVLLKARMLHEGTARQCYMRKGHIVDKVSYAILAEDYFKKTRLTVKIIQYEQKYHDDMLFCYLAAKDAIGEYAPDKWRKPSLKDDLLDISTNYIEKGDIFCLAIDDRDRVVGMIGTNSISPTELLLKRLFVKPEYKGKGIGSDLLSFIEKYAVSKGITTIHTRFAYWYREAAVFYPAKGFIEIERTEHLIHMAKQLH